MEGLEEKSNVGEASCDHLSPVFLPRPMKEYLVGCQSDPLQPFLLGTAISVSPVAAVKA